MSTANNALQQSALMMKIMGSGLILGPILAAFLYSPGFLWGRLRRAARSELLAMEIP